MISSNYFQNRFYAVVPNSQTTTSMVTRPSSQPTNKKTSIADKIPRPFSQQTSFAATRNIFKAITLMPSIEEIRYTYSAQKIDFVLPQLFTLLSLMMVIVRVFSADYRRWCIKIEAANVLYAK